MKRMKKTYVTAAHRVLIFVHKIDLPNYEKSVCNCYLCVSIFCFKGPVYINIHIWLNYTKKYSEVKFDFINLIEDVQYSTTAWTPESTTFLTLDLAPSTYLTDVKQNLDLVKCDGDLDFFELSCGENRTRARFSSKGVTTQYQADFKLKLFDTFM